MTTAPPAERQDSMALTASGFMKESSALYSQLRIEYTSNR